VDGNTGVAVATPDRSSAEKTLLDKDILEPKDRVIGDESALSLAVNNRERRRCQRKLRKRARDNEKERKRVRAPRHLPRLKECSFHAAARNGPFKTLLLSVVCTLVAYSRVLVTGHNIWEGAERRLRAAMAAI